MLQASFDPPGLSVAVKKDRAAEAFLAVGSKFVVNILAEGKEKPVIKQLLKSFKPGEDRFAGLETQVRHLPSHQYNCPPKHCYNTFFMSVFYPSLTLNPKNTVAFPVKTNCYRAPSLQPEP